jgi:hypothetical protein
MRKFIRLFGLWLVASIVVAAFALLWIWPWRPHSVLGWSILLIAALPLTTVGEYLVERFVFGSPLGARLDALGSGVTASALRILYVLICALVIGVVGVCAFAWLNRTGWLGAI